MKVNWSFWQKKSHLKHRWISSQLSLLPFFFTYRLNHLQAVDSHLFSTSALRFCLSRKNSHKFKASPGDNGNDNSVEFFYGSGKRAHIGANAFLNSHLNWKIPFSKIFTWYFSNLVVFFSRKFVSHKARSFIWSQLFFDISTLHIGYKLSADPCFLRNVFDFSIKIE